MENLSILDRATAPASARPTRLLVVADTSPESQRAVEAAGELSRSLGGEVLVVHIHERDANLVGTGDFRTKDEAENFLSDVIDRLLGLDTAAKGELYVTRRGHAANAILKASSAPGIDLILMGSPRPQGLRSTLGRSLVEKVIRRSTRPVLAVP